MRRVLFPLLLLASLASCAGVYVQSDFAADLDAAGFAQEVLPAHEPLYLEVPGEDGAGGGDGMLVRFRDALAMTFAERGVQMTDTRDSAGAVLTVHLSRESREVTRWDRHYEPSIVRYCPDGRTIVVRRGWSYSTPYYEARTWYTFSGALRVAGDAAPLWTGIASFSELQRGATVEAAGRRLASLLLDGQEQSLRHESLKL